MVLEPCCPKEFPPHCCASLFCSVSLNLKFFFWTAWFELLGALVVDSRGAITVAALRDVNLRKRCVALPRYIVYVYSHTK